MSAHLTFDALREQNYLRALRWHPGFPDDDDWTGADWSNAMCGEAGETANVVKKLRRVECDLKGSLDVSKEELREQLAMEIGDTLVYLDLLATYYDLRLSDCAVRTFNRVSDREGFPERL